MIVVHIQVILIQVVIMIVILIQEQMFNNVTGLAGQPLPIQLLVLQQLQLVLMERCKESVLLERLVLGMIGQLGLKLLHALLLRQRALTAQLK
jgi:hypothetical protein